MRRISRIPATLTILLVILVLFNHQGRAQSTWEGQFMEQFRVNIFLDGLGTGTIRMYDGPNQIQNDGLVKVKIEECQLTFNIPAKQTNFNGKISESGTLITGNFIFPDGSLHPLVLKQVVEPETTNNFITNTAAAEDLHQLYTAIKEYHPQPFAYITPAEFDRLYSEVTQISEENIPINKLYFKAARLTEAIKCSHTGVRLPNEMNAKQHELPIKIFYDKEQLYILESPDKMIPAGSLLTSINGRHANELIADLKILVPVNGHNSTTKANVINQKFSTMLPLLDDSEEYVVEYRNNGVAGRANINATAKSVKNPEGLDIMIFEPRSEEMAYLKIPSFGIRDMDRYFANLDKIFAELQSAKTKNLVLDLRDNSGGHPIFAAQLLSYLTDQEFTYFIRNPEVPDFEPLYNPMQPNARHFNGNLYVLVNGGCLSTSGHLISLLKEYTRAKFIGEQPGSTYTCNDFSKKIMLGNSHLELNLPTTTFETKVNGPAKAVPFPVDYLVEETLLGKLALKDAYMDMVRAVIIPQEAY